MGLELAARSGDPISHTSREGWGTALAILGAVVGAVIVIATAPVSIPTLAVAATVAAGATATVATTTLAGAAIGEAIGSNDTDPTAGYIVNGASTVFTGPGMPEAARMSDPIDCHPGQKIADGSDSVFIEGWNASRKTDETWCAGKISDGCHTVLIGGDRIGQYGSQDRSELSRGYRLTMTVVDWAGTIASLGGKTAFRELALPVAGLLIKAYSASGLPLHDEVGAYGGTAVTALSLLTGKRPSNWTLQETTDNVGSVIGGGSSINNEVTREGPPRTYGPPPRG
jgi:uncharacterized Zn-binding protein involved in type VI secretion